MSVAPATVLIRPCGPTRRMRWLLVGDEELALAAHDDPRRLVQPRLGGRAAVVRQREAGVHIAGDARTGIVASTAVDEAARGPPRSAVAAFICSLDIL
jgi:hypothetical protein